MNDKINSLNALPIGFFNLLSSNSNSKLNIGCLLTIYREYDREISYRIGRKDLRDSLAEFLNDYKINMGVPEELTGDVYSDATSIITKFCQNDVGWLIEEIDDATFDKYIVMSEQGVALAEFLERLDKPEKVEYSSYVNNMYNTLCNREQWSDNPYVGALKNVYKNARDLSKALKKLSTFIRKHINEIMKEKSLEELTDKLIDYCNGEFIREYARLNNQQNIHIYRQTILSKLNEIYNDEEMRSLLVLGCAIEEEITEDEADEKVYEMYDATKRFLSDDYNRIMADIRHKINMHMHIAVGRIRFIRSHGTDNKGMVEQALKLLVETSESNQPNNLFLFDRNDYLDLNSVKYPSKQRIIKEAFKVEVEDLTEEMIQYAAIQQKHEAYNPYSKERMKKYLDDLIKRESSLALSQIPVVDKNDVLSIVSSLAYGKENGYEVEIKDGYKEVDNIIIHDFEIRRL